MVFLGLLRESVLLTVLSPGSTSGVVSAEASVVTGASPLQWAALLTVFFFLRRLPPPSFLFRFFLGSFAGVSSSVSFFSGSDFAGSGSSCMGPPATVFRSV